MADERELIELCRDLCRPERDAVLIQVESDDPALADRVRRALEKEAPQR
jgi:hypothetical protein